MQLNATNVLHHLLSLAMYMLHMSYLFYCTLYSLLYPIHVYSCRTCLRSLLSAAPLVAPSSVQLPNQRLEETSHSKEQEHQSSGARPNPPTGTTMKFSIGNFYSRINIFRSSQQLTCFCLGPFGLLRLFELPRRPLRALNLPGVLLPELQRFKDTVRCVSLGSKVIGDCQEQLMQNLIVPL